MYRSRRKTKEDEKKYLASIGIPVESGESSSRSLPSIRDQIREVYGDSHRLSTVEEYIRNLHIQEQQTKRQTGPSLPSPHKKVSNWLETSSFDSGDDNADERGTAASSNDSGSEKENSVGANMGLPSRLNVHAVPFTPLAQCAPKEDKLVMLDNLAVDTDDGVLRGMLEGFGVVGSIQIIRENSSVQARVSVADLDTAEWIVSCLDGTLADGQDLAVRARIKS